MPNDNDPYAIGSVGNPNEAITALRALPHRRQATVVPPPLRPRQLVLGEEPPALGPPEAPPTTGIRSTDGVCPRHLTQPPAWRAGRYICSVCGRRLVNRDRYQRDRVRDHHWREMVKQ
jgi:hypothetical protein